MSKRFMDFNSGEDVTEHIEKQFEAEDLIRRKAERFDRLMVESRFDLAFWRKLYDAHPELKGTNVGGFYEGMVAAYTQVLYYATKDEKVSEKEACEKVGSEKENHG